MIDSLGSVVRVPDNFPRKSEKAETAKGIEANDGMPQDSNTGEEYQLSGEFSKDQVQQAVNQLNKTMETYHTELRFQLHEKSGEYMVKIVNPKDNSIVKELPPEKILDMVAYFKEILGLVVDKFA
ncbi:flagellar protein FlaG [Desulforamulus ferrireducens]|uniref:Flagellar biosynthesis protein FlaG n=1 Tax=Desulforamulus ferrireducens TaxID=1833852 RepID=A0A1S6IYJ3_9FIRM|nr:flagellar protein FlaG [Desulforamulus ferrireducens]AQS59831.1 flagellar biosynthesis protein FlaG [Desulforamulus ferrireducens]